MSEDEYVEMQDNPVHLAIDFGGDPILDMFRKGSMWSDVSKRLNFILEERANQEALKCLNDLNFHSDSPKFSNSSNLILPGEIIPVQNWIEKSFNTIKESVKTDQFPCRLPKDAKSIEDTIIKLKDLLRSFQSPPIMTASQNQELFREMITYDFGSLSEYSRCKLDLCDLIKTSYTEFINIIGKKRLTRFNQSLIQGKIPLPLDIFFECLDFDVRQHSYSKMLKIREDTRSDVYLPNSHQMCEPS